MAGKSELIISILRKFNPIWANKPPSSIIYCARGSIPHNYLAALRQVATELQVKLHIFPDGVSSLPFKTSWHRALRKRQISERQEAEHSRDMEENNNVNNYNDNNNDDDDDDDDDDDNDHKVHDRKKQHQSTNNKECIELMTDIIENRRPMSQPRASSLSIKPKMTSLKKIKNFLTLNDRNMKRSRHIALSKEREKMPVKRQNVESETNAAGGVLTRSKSRLLGHDAHIDASRPIHESGTARKRNKIDKINEPSNDPSSHTRKSHDSNLPSDQNTSSAPFHGDKEFSNGNKHTPLRDEDEETECEWLKSSVLILDDHLCFNSIPPAFKSGGSTSSDSNASTSSTAKQNKEQQQEILQFIQSLTTLYCHHMGIHLIATR